MARISIENAKSHDEIEYAIREVHSERGFDFSKEEWDAIKKAGYDKLDVARLCCEYAVLAEVECYERYLIIAWDKGPSEEAVLALLEHRYDQWVHIEENPEVESYCCEEWMIDGLTGIGDFQFFVLYGKYDE